MKYLIITIPAMMLLLFSCQSDSPAVITLHTPQQDGNSIILKWDKPDMEDFEYYAVMRSHNKKNYNVINDISNKSANAFKADITTYTDNAYPIDADTLYYKIMVVGKTQTAVSRDVMFRATKPVIITGPISNVYYIPETNQASIFVGDMLKTLDLQTGEYLLNTPLNSSSYNYLWSQYNGQTEFYLYSNYKLHVYNAATTQKITEIECDPYDANITANGKGHIYVCDGYKIYTINRVTGTYTTYTANDTYFTNLYYDGVKNILYAVNVGMYYIFSLDNAGNITGYTKYNYPTIASGISHTNLFPVLHFSDGYKVLDLYSNSLHNLELPYYTYLSNNGLCLAGNSIYIADMSYYYDKIYDSNSVIYQLSASDYKLVATHNTRFTPVYLFASKDYLYCLGVDMYNSNTFVLDKIKL